MTKEELQAMTQEELKSLVVETSKVIKQYVDENTISKDEVEKIEKANTLAESLIGLFDENGDDAISKEEFVNKLNEIYATLSNVKEIKDQITNLAKSIGAISKDVENLKANVETNFFTKDDVAGALSINKDEIIDEVKSIFGMNTEENGDGATL